MKKIFLFSIFGFLILFFLKTSTIQAAKSYLKTTITLPSDSRPHYVAVDNVRHRVYLASHNDNSLYVIDSLTDSLVATIPLGSRPEGVAVAINSGLIYVSDIYNHAIWVIDGATNSVVKTISDQSFDFPFTLTIDEIHNRLYIVNSLNHAPLNGTVSVLDTVTDTVSTVIPIGVQPRGAVVNPLTNRLYVASARNQPGLMVFDTTTYNLMSTIDLAISLETVALDEVLNRIYVAYQFAGIVFAIDGATNSVIEEIHTHTDYVLNPIGL